MPDLTTQEVQALLGSLGLAAQDEEDLHEVTQRINAIHEALLALDPPGLDAQEPVTIFGQEEALS